MSTAFRPAPRSRRSMSDRRSPLPPMPANQRRGKKGASKQPLAEQALAKQALVQPPPFQRAPNGARPPLRAVPSPIAGMATVKRLPAPRSMPLWLRLLVQVQRGSLVIAFLLVTATLIVYGSTVYTQQLWSKEYRKLKTLHRNEREMVAASTGLENQLALQAERPDSGLVPQNQDSTLFLQPAPLRPAAAAAVPSVPKVDVAPNTPLGY